MTSIKKQKPTNPDLKDSLSFLNSVNEENHEKENFLEYQTSKKFEKKNKNTQIIFRTTEQNKNELKSFFAGYGITLSKGVQLACFYLEQQIKIGKVDISDAGLISK